MKNLATKLFNYLSLPILMQIIFTVICIGNETPTLIRLLMVLILTVIGMYEGFCLYYILIEEDE